MPTTLPALLQTPAMLSTEPFGLSPAIAENDLVVRLQAANVFFVTIVAAFAVRDRNLDHVAFAHKPVCERRCVVLDGQVNLGGNGTSANCCG